MEARGASISHLCEPLSPWVAPVYTAEESVEPRPVHPDSHEMYKMCGGKFAWTRYVPIFGPAVECYGPKFVFSLDFTEFLSKGLAYNLLQNASQPMFVNRYKCTAMEYQRYNNVASMGWSIKPFTALISDSFPLFHYTKRWYMVLSCLIGGAGSIVFGCLPGSHSSAATAAAMAFLAGYGQANLDILSEGWYSRLMRRYPAAGPALVSSLWWMLSVAGIIAAFIQGPLSDGGMEQVGAFVAGACMLAALPFFIFNWFGELTNREERMADRRATLEDDVRVHPMERDFVVVKGDSPPVNSSVATSHRGADEDDDDVTEDNLLFHSVCRGALEINHDALLRHPRCTIYAVSLTVGVVATVIATINGSTWPLLITCCIVTGSLGVMSFWALPPIVAKAGLYVFLIKTLYVNLAGPLQTFYVATKEEYPPGPHFSYFFYNATSSAIGNVAALIAASIFPYVFAKRTYRFTFILTTIIIITGSIFDLIMVKRWNRRVGVPDHITFIWGDAVVYQVGYLLNWIPVVLLLVQLCPRGSESTIYSLLAGYSNLGSTMGGEIGTLLMDFVWPVKTSVRPYDFTHLPWLIVVGHLLLPLLLIPSVFVLIPDARISDSLCSTHGNVVMGEDEEEDGQVLEEIARDDLHDAPTGEQDVENFTCTSMEK